MDMMSSSDGGDRGVQSDKSAQRRRRTCSEDEKQPLVAESFVPGASVSDVAQRHAINANLLFTWRRQMRPLPIAEASMELIPVEIVSAPESSPAVAAATTTLRRIAKRWVNCDIDALIHWNFKPNF